MTTRKYTPFPYTEYTVADGRFDTSRAPIDRIVLHTMVGTSASTRSLFASPPPVGKETSAHYGIGYDGSLDAYLEEYYTAYHCGNYSYNQRSIGIEHEDKGQYNSPRPDALYNESAKLVADICKFYNIPCDNTHILRHHDVPGASTACPDSLDTDRIINSAKLILAGNTPPMNDKRPGWFDILSKTEFGTTGWEKLTDAQINKWASDLTVRKTGNGKWDEICAKAGLPTSSTPDQVAAKLQGNSFDKNKFLEAIKALLFA